MVDTLTLGIVLLVGVYFVTLAAVAMFAPCQAKRFLLGFAGTARAHYIELTLRAAAGGAFVLQAPRMPVASAFAVFGWLLLLTTGGLAVLPWRWHRAFAQRAVPYATRRLALVGAASLVLGGLVLAAAFARDAA